MKVVVIGAGLAGLAAATWIAHAGHDVEIFEQSENVGGRAKTIKHSRSNDFVDAGTQYFHSNYTRALELIKIAGLKDSLRPIKGKTKFFDESLKHGSFITGHRLPYITSGSLFQNIHIFLKGLFRLAVNPINPYSVLEKNKLDHIEIKDVITSPFEWEYTVRTLVVAGALTEPEGQSISYLHLIRLMRIILMTDYLCLDGGIASLHTTLAEKFKIHYDAPIAKIESHNGQVKGCTTRAGERIDADHVIVATPPESAAQILPKDWTEEIRFLTSIDQPSAITVTLFLKQPLESKIWSYMFQSSQERIVSFCIDASQKNPHMVPSGNAALQAWICHPKAEQVMAMSDEELLEEVLDELEVNFAGLRKMVDEMYVNRVEKAIPQMSVDHNERSNLFLKQVDKRPFIDFCGDYLSGGYMESSLWSSKRAVKQILSKSSVSK